MGRRSTIQGPVVKRTPDGKSNAPKGNGKNSQKGGSSGKGSKRSGKGKKGKMFAVLDDEGNWWYTDATGSDEAAPDAPGILHWWTLTCHVC